MDIQFKLFETQINPVYQVAEIEIHYKTKVNPSERPHISSSRASYDILLSIWDSNAIEYKEEFKILLLNQSNKVLGAVNVSKGGVSSTVVDAKIVFGAALKANASFIILAHNHPSGNLTPSEPDKRLTQKLKQAGEFLDLKILDHIILTKEGYYSFADEGSL
ncbi:MAG: JAB domain-containing protein [Chitinophagaceae bacterium]